MLCSVTCVMHIVRAAFDDHVVDFLVKKRRHSRDEKVPVAEFLSQRQFRIQILIVSVCTRVLHLKSVRERICSEKEIKNFHF